MRTMKEENKDLRGRGQGDHGTYVGWILPKEIPDIGVSSYVRDPYTQRMVGLLSQGENMLWHKLRWRQDVDDIREQFPLNLEDTNRIADEFGYRRAGNGRYHMTTDLLVTLNDGSLEAYAVKATHDDADRKRTREKLEIEERYWQERGVPWHLVCKEDLNKDEWKNIRDVFSAYDTRFISNDMGWIRHLIAVRAITVDMTRRFDYAALAEEYRENSYWKQLVSEMKSC